MILAVLVLEANNYSQADEESTHNSKNAVTDNDDNNNTSTYKCSDNNGDNKQQYLFAHAFIHRTTMPFAIQYENTYTKSQIESQVAVSPAYPPHSAHLPRVLTVYCFFTALITPACITASLPNDNYNPEKLQYTAKYSDITSSAYLNQTFDRMLRSHYPERI